jgi:aspartyl-tRNA(Asn)/glutamyl-tRNA(Gln) amidotransferase subunit C
MSHPQALAQRLREDRVAEADQRDRFQSVAPQVEDGLYLVPKVID